MTSISTRRFCLRHRRRKDLKLDLPLSHGSLLCMSGETQHHWLHAVLKHPSTAETVVGTGGNGSGSGTLNYGVYLNNGSVTGAVNTNVSVTGTGGSSSGIDNYGVRVSGASAAISTTGTGTSIIAAQ